MGVYGANQSILDSMIENSSASYESRNHIRNYLEYNSTQMLSQPEIVSEMIYFNFIILFINEIDSKEVRILIECT